MSLNAFVVALALSIAKAKPDSISIQEHLRRTRDHLFANSSREHIVSIEQLQHTVKHLRSRLFAREDEISALMQREKQLEETLRLSNDHGLNTYAQSLTPFCGEDLKVGTDAGGSAGLPREHYQDILYHTLKIEYVLKKSDRIVEADFTKHLLRIATSIGHLTRYVLLLPLINKNDKLLRSTITACARAASILLEGEKFLSVHSGSLECCRQVDYAIVNLFSELVLLLDEAAPQEPFHTNQHQQFTARPATRSTTKSFEDMQSKKAQQSEVIMLTAFIGHVLDTLDANTPAHVRLFEGFLTCIMSTVGQSLFRMTFGHVKGANVEEDIRAACSTSRSPCSADSACTPSLVHLLERSLAMAARFKLGDTEAAAVVHCDVQTVSEVARLHLQKMLLESICGTDDSAMNEVPPGERLAPLKQCLASTTLPTVKAVHADQWFQEAVWRAIGWEILAS